jgi:hypothetical protein
LIWVLVLALVLALILILIVVRIGVTAVGGVMMMRAVMMMGGHWQHSVAEAFLQMPVIEHNIEKRA